MDAKIKWILLLGLVPLLFVTCHGSPSVETDTLSINQSIADGQTLTSQGGRFKLGFFSPSNSSSNRYVAIWYNFAGPELAIIWIANRDSPVSGYTGILKFTANAGLVLVDGTNTPLWSTNTSATTSNQTVKLQNSGNLVMIQSDGMVIWNSFDHLTDTFVPMSKLSFDFVTKKNNTITSWKSWNDPSCGRFSLGLQSNGLNQGVIWDGSAVHWRTGPWIGQKFIGVPDMVSNDMNGFSVNREGSVVTLKFAFYNESAAVARIVLGPEGEVSEWLMNDATKEWFLNWKKPEDRCDLYLTCGEFALCDPSSSPICSCLQGFVPKSSDDWAKGNWSGGCVRRKELACKDGNSTIRSDGFLKLENLKLPDSASWTDARKESDCSEQCLKKCGCVAYAYVEGTCLTWDKGLADIKKFTKYGEDLYLKLMASELEQSLENNSSSKKTKKHIVIITLVVVLGTSFLAFFFYTCIFFTKHKDTKRKNDNSNKLIITDLISSMGREEHVISFKDSSTEREGLDFLQYDLGLIVKAVDGFNPNNKLGEGGFGPVFKGALADGVEIAVKRLSKRSSQGLKEFKNEVLLISKLQHRNLVRLLGYCLNEEEKLLIYEFLPNGSLDTFLFGVMKKNLLDWSKRVQIIEGIAQGILYLHRDSRLRIIHRDLKASNILLDAELNPKISDFGTARIFGVDKTIATRNIVGTFGYISPEYAMQGLFSEKSDVYSFGVMLLEIVSSISINTFVDKEYSLNLLGYAWKLWKEGDAIKLVDENLRDSWPYNSAIKCITVALLCVQEYVADRPVMSSVVSMLTSNGPITLTPKEPVFTRQCSLTNLSSSDGDTRVCSTNGVTFTGMEGR